MKYFLYGYYDKNGNYIAKLRECVLVNYDEFFTDTFCTECEYEITGWSILRKGNWMLQKERARERAIATQNIVSKGNLTYAELAIIGRQLEKMARRYGLVREFRENGII